jgi:hypothetical protein
MVHTTVRISEAARDTLRAMSEASGKPMQALLDEAIEALRRTRFLEQVNAAYATLRGDPKAWSATEAERRQWDGTLLDGLEVQGKSPYAASPRRRAKRKKT